MIERGVVEVDFVGVVSVGGFLLGSDVRFEVGRICRC